jgi:hypothetical protein
MVLFLDMEELNREPGMPRFLGAFLLVQSFVGCRFLDQDALLVDVRTHFWMGCSVV